VGVRYQEFTKSELIILNAAEFISLLDVNLLFAMYHPKHIAL